MIAMLFGTGQCRVSGCGEGDTGRQVLRTYRLVPFTRAVSTLSAGTGFCSNAATMEAASISSENVNPRVFRARAIFADSSAVNLTRSRCAFPEVLGTEVSQSKP